MKKLLLLLALAGLSLSVAAQNPEDRDWARFSRYASQNSLKHKPVAVLMGDSITDGWARYDNGWLKDHGLLGRGISGQTTAEMLVRFRPDVIELNPDYVAILAGNDVVSTEAFPAAQFGNVELLSGDLFNKHSGTRLWLNPLSGAVDKLEAEQPK